MDNDVIFSDVDANDADKIEDEELDEADEEIDKDQQASDEWEIQELANEVDVDICFFVRASNLELGQSAMTKVCGKSIRIFHGLTLCRLQSWQSKYSIACSCAKIWLPLAFMQRLNLSWSSSPSLLGGTRLLRW